MAAPYVCITCRARLTPSILQPRRFLSHSAIKSQHHAAALERDAFFGTSNEPRATQRQTPTSRTVNGNSSRNTVQRGRYSGKELRPDDLLGHLGLDIARGYYFEQDGTGSTVQDAAGHRGSRATTLSNRDDQAQARSATRQRRRDLDAHERRFVSEVRKGHLKEAWQTLEQLSQRHDQGDAHNAPPLLGKDGFIHCLRELFPKVTRQWLDGVRGTKQDIPLGTPLDMLDICYRLNLTNASIYQPALYHVALGLADLQFAQAHENERAQAIESGIRLLVRMWRVCVARKAFQVSGRDSSDKARIWKDKNDWSFLPSPATFTSRTPEQRSPEAFDDNLKMVLPSNGTTNARKVKTDYATPALITLDLLRECKVIDTNGEHSTLAQLPEHAPFVQLLEAMMGTAKPRPLVPFGLSNKVRELATLNNQALIRQYEAMFVRLGLHESKTQDSLPAEAHSVMDTEALSVSVSDSANVYDERVQSKLVQFSEKPQSPAIARFALLNVKKLGKAIEKRDMYFVDNVRREVAAFASSHKHDPKVVPIELYEHLMLAYLTLRNPQTAVEIWKQIIELGYQPTVRTYSVMMRGARTSKDRAGMEAFWQKMRDAGLQPDAHAWSNRIYGLFGLKANREGMQALSDMSREWLTAAISKASSKMTQAQKNQMMSRQDLVQHLLSQYPQPDIDGVPRPTVAIMNSAISSLAQGKEDRIPDVLRWGRSLDIAPDLTTYNALLNVALRKGQGDEVMNILASMQKRGVQADSTTWTVILTAQFRGGFLDGLEAAQQEQKILDLITSLESKETGLPRLDEKSYALIMDRLLKQYNNPKAAEAVMTHMIKSGRQPTCYIYTMLMTAYFDQRPQPDIVAVQHLWAYIENQNRGWRATLDNVFYDRMIENYAMHHRLVGMQPALDFLARARRAGQTTAWRALEYVARALAERQDWGKVRSIVDQARADYLARNRAGTQVYGMVGFFNFILETGLYRKDGISSVQDFIGARPEISPLARAGHGLED